MAGKNPTEYSDHGENLNIPPGTPANAVMTGEIVFDPYTNISTFTGKWGFTLKEIKEGLCNPCVYKGKFREPENVAGTFTFSTQDGKQKIGVYVVLDDKVDINQQTLFEAVNKVSEMNEKTSRFLLKTF